MNTKSQKCRCSLHASYEWFLRLSSAWGVGLKAVKTACYISAPDAFDCRRTIRYGSRRCCCYWFNHGPPCVRRNLTLCTVLYALASDAHRVRRDRATQLFCQAPAARLSAASVGDGTVAEQLTGSTGDFPWRSVISCIHKPLGGQTQTGMTGIGH